MAGSFWRPYGVQPIAQCFDQPPQVALWTSVFYVSSALAGIMNKQIISEYQILPTTLTMWHLVLSVGCDGAFSVLPPGTGSKLHPAILPSCHCRASRKSPRASWQNNNGTRL